MESNDAATIVKSLAALAQPLRLQVFRALVVAGPAGMTPGAIGTQLEIPATTLSFHLKELANAGLTQVQRDGRNLIYRADYAQMNALIGYLTAHCCAGQQPCVDTQAAACAC
jgi:ArsR family transcriptional regulator, arsenate/arsenite/antimonite-responsive transcriptional repressor